ncbi:hypothetical protein HDC94_001171 [Leifsonia sp. AK011]|uniref:BMP family ABC transporter substrate-binding protein n=1 Tax=Leifsonia sp. AK011 TaxID=2723075 RepID=UPI0015C8AC0E|nr:BMP family ABC transporter substrate-binding protein [Leifsonia sp. AK011]NYF10015.1 hypothetical protein [Leifsonia sp. AK011]
MRLRLPLTVSAIILSAALLVSCVPAAEVSTTTSGTDVALGPEFLGSNPSPSPEATISPEAGSWEGVEPPHGYRVGLITATSDPTADALARGVMEWAAARDIHVEIWAADNDDEIEAAITEASEERDIDLVIGAGRGIVDIFALITSQHLAQEFLVVGAQLPEPTHNVTAVVWPGASFRGSGISEATDAEDSAATDEQALTATGAGVASVLHGYTGIVLALDD